MMRNRASKRSDGCTNSRPSAPTPRSAIADCARERDGIGERRDALVDEHELVARPVRLHDRDAGRHGATASLSSGTSDVLTGPFGEIVETACL